MAVLNLTPDSFYDGGLHQHPRRALERVDALIAMGADVIDIGPESTRPGAAPVSAKQQWSRAGAAIEYAVKQGAFVSVDTTLPEVARTALECGAAAINDVSCLAQEELADVCREHDADLVLMHSRGSMAQMVCFSEYDERAYGDVVDDVKREWSAARDRAVARGLDASRIWFDPGLGFHKSAAHSRELMCRLEEFMDLQAPMVVGASRKSFIGALDDSAPEQRLGGTIAAGLRSVAAGARVLRVHDVAEMRQALLAWVAFGPGRPGTGGAEAARHSAHGGPFEHRGESALISLVAGREESPDA